MISKSACLLTLSYDHTNGIRRDFDRIIDLISCISSIRIESFTFALLWGSHGFGVTVDNLQDEFFGLSGSLRSSNEVHRAEAVHTLILTNDIDMAAASFLQITDCLTTATNDQSNGTIRHHNLDTILPFTKSRLVATLGDFASTTSLTSRVSAIFFNDPINFALCFQAGARISGDSTLSLPSIVGAGHELDSGRRNFFNTAEIIARPTDHKANQRRINDDDFRVVMSWR